MLVTNPNRRIKIRDILEHPWISQINHRTFDEEFKDEMVGSKVLDNLQKFRGQSLLKKAAMNVLVKHLDGGQIRDLKTEFQKLDTNKSGFLERSNLRTVLMNYRQDSLDSKTVT